VDFPDFTRNDAALNFTNGDTGEVQQVYTNNNSQLRIVIQKDNGEFVTVSQEKYSNGKGHIFLAPAYAQTIYSAQGKTIDGNVYVLHDPMIDRANAYVAMSRHKDDCHLYVSTDHVIGDYDEGLNDKTLEELIIEKVSTQFNSQKRAKLSIEYDRVITANNSQIEAQEKYKTEMVL
jgi:ATP-dependent exoDNAse (exonuclease V) alpha subunit